MTRTLLLNGALGVAGYWAARYGFGMPAGLPRGLAAFTVAWAWATLGMEVLGLAGFLNYGALLAWTAAGLIIAWAFRSHDVRPSTAGRSLQADQGEAWEPEAIVAVGLVVWAAAIWGLGSLLGPVKVVSDAPIYHLYFAVQWWKAGRLCIVPAPFGETVVSYFPAVGDLWFTWLVAAWGGERLAKVGQLPFLVVAAFAAYASARRLGARVSAAIIAATWFAGVFPFLLFSTEANVDTIFVAAYLLAAYFFLRLALNDEGTSDLVLGALALGGVLGTKPSGFVFGGLLLGVAALVVWLRRASLRETLENLALLVVLPLVMVGYWYGRNAWLTGNPLYPLQVRVLGKVWLAGWYGPEVMTQSQYYIARDNWRALGDILLAVFDPRQLPFWAVASGGAWSLGRRKTNLDGFVWAFSALALANVATYWIAVPYRSQQRFMLQACGLLVVPLSRLLDRARLLRVVAVALLAMHLVTAQSWPFGPAERDPPWDLTRLVPNVVDPLVAIPYLVKVRRGELVDPDDITGSLAILALGVLALAGAWLWSRPGRRGQVRAVAGTIVLGAAAIALAYPFQSDPRGSFYPGFADYYRGWMQLDAVAGASGARIAYAGTNLPYYLFGVGLRNEVRYVNVDEHRAWLMHDYHRRARARGESGWPNPWPGWDRQFPSYDAWLANLRAERIDLLVVASRGRRPRELPDADAERFPIERRWAEAHPESFEPLYGVAERDSKFRIYRVRPVHQGPTKISTSAVIPSWRPAGRWSIETRAVYTFVAGAKRKFVSGRRLMSSSFPVSTWPGNASRRIDAGCPGLTRSKAASGILTFTRMGPSTSWT
jgi:hypothetical protein